MRWSREPHRLALIALAAGAATIGVIAEWQGFTWTDTRSWVPDLLVGWTLAGLGIAAGASGRPRGLAALLFVGGLAWFVGDFHEAAPHWFGSVAAHLGWVFLAPLLQLALAYPSGRPRSWVIWAAVAAAWLLAAAQWINWNDDTSLALALSGFAVVGIAHTRRAAREAVVGVGALILLVLWALVVPRLGLSVRPIAFDAGVVLVGAWFYTGVRGGARLAERAIELDESTGSLRSALAAVLGDPDLEVGFATENGRFVDDLGRGVRPTPGRHATELADASGVVGLIVHDPRLLRSPRDREAVTGVVALAGTRARMREVLRRRTDDISQSMLKLIRAGDDERLRLSARLDTEVRPPLDEAARLLAQAGAKMDGPELAGAIVRAAKQLRRAESELAAFASGLGVPALVQTLPSAIGGLVDGLPFDVELRVCDLECTSELAGTIWFVCSEGVSNVLKHAGGSKVLIEITADLPRITVVVEDDGRGGADANGSGLAGLRDRVAALGGNLRVEERPGGGTRLVASLSQAVPTA